MLIKEKTIVDEENNRYNVEICLGSDMKFIEILLGLGTAASKHACPWCHVAKSDISDISKPFELYQSSEMKRTAASLRENAKTKSLGSKHQPLLDIEPDDIIPDDLHLLLRICDKLLKNLIDDAKNVETMSDILGSKVKTVETLAEKIRDCGVNFHIWKSKSESLDIEWSSLNGDDYKKLLSNLPEKLCFLINHDTHDSVVDLWRSFGELYKYISYDATAATPAVQVFD